MLVRSAIVGLVGTFGCLSVPPPLATDDGGGDSDGGVDAGALDAALDPLPSLDWVLGHGNLVIFYDDGATGRPEGITVTGARSADNPNTGPWFTAVDLEPPVVAGAAVNTATGMLIVLVDSTYEVTVITDATQQLGLNDAVRLSTKLVNEGVGPVTVAIGSSAPPAAENIVAVVQGKTVATSDFFSNPSLHNWDEWSETSVTLSAQTAIFRDRISEASIGPQDLVIGAVGGVEFGTVETTDGSVSFASTALPPDGEHPVRVEDCWGFVGFGPEGLRWIDVDCDNGSISEIPYAFPENFYTSASGRALPSATSTGDALVYLVEQGPQLVWHVFPEALPAEPMELAGAQVSQALTFPEGEPGAPEEPSSEMRLSVWSPFPGIEAAVVFLPDGRHACYLLDEGQNVAACPELDFAF